MELIVSILIRLIVESVFDLGDFVVLIKHAHQHFEIGIWNIVLADVELLNF